jgi:chemotaxis protein methyltransferase CheR
VHPLSHHFVTAPLPTLSAGPPLSADDFRRVCRIAYDVAGIAIPAGKEGLVRSRLATRMRDTGHDSIRAFLDCVQQDKSGEQMTALIDLLTTNKTNFFREPAHFDLLTSRILPRIAAERAPLRIWSAACSSGEEPYTIGMLLNEHLPDVSQAKILATDISTRILARARAAQYSAEQLDGVSPHRRSTWFRETPSPTGTRYIVDARVRSLVRFAYLNLMTEWPMSGPFDVIFCRNVMIYFDKATQERLVNRFATLLAPGGYLFIGHSESLNGMQHPYQYVQPAVYLK